MSATAITSLAGSDSKDESIDGQLLLLLGSGPSEGLRGHQKRLGRLVRPNKPGKGWVRLRGPLRTSKGLKRQSQ